MAAISVNCKDDKFLLQTSDYQTRSKDRKDFLAGKDHSKDYNKDHNKDQNTVGMEDKVGKGCKVDKDYKTCKDCRLDKARKAWDTV